MMSVPSSVFLALLGGLFLSEVPQAQTFRQLADANSLNFGTPAIQRRAWPKLQGPYADTIVKHYNMVFPENALKFYAVQPQRGKFAWAYPDSILAFAKARGMKARGHELVWHSLSQNPKWLTDNLWSVSAHIWTREELLGILKNHIDSVVGHYKGQILEWDVVNEPLAESFTPGVSPLRSPASSFWMRIIGEDYIDSAFVWAHRADPEAYLYLNDFGIENEVPAYDGAKSDSLYALVKRLLARGVPIHGVGLESHFGTNTGTPWISQSGLSFQIKRLGALGLRVSLTELDIRGTSKAPWIWKSVAAACLENFNCVTMATWGVDDSVSWYGAKSDCLLWDSLGNPKQAAQDSLRSAFLKASPTIALQRKNFAAIPAVLLNNAAPTASLSASANSILLGSSVTLTALATDPDGTLEKVELLQNGKVIQTLPKAPWTFSVNGLALGSYNFTVRATDNKLASTTSSVVTVTVKAPANQSPTALPLEDSAYAGTARNIPLKATDPDGTIAGYAIDVPPAHGTARIEGTQLVYTAKTEFVGLDTLQFHAIDDQGATSAVVLLVVKVKAQQVTGLQSRAGTTPRKTNVDIVVLSPMAPVRTSDGPGTLGLRVPGCDESAVCQHVGVLLPTEATLRVTITDNMGVPVIGWSTTLSRSQYAGLTATKDGRRLAPLQWNLRSASGRRVPVGVYLWKIDVVPANDQSLESVHKLGVVPEL